MTGFFDKLRRGCCSSAFLRGKISQPPPPRQCLRRFPIHPDFVSHASPPFGAK